MGEGERGRGKGGVNGFFGVASANGDFASHDANLAGADILERPESIPAAQPRSAGPCNMGVGKFQRMQLRLRKGK